MIITFWKKLILLAALPLLSASVLAAGASAVNTNDKGLAIDG